MKVWYFCLNTQTTHAHRVCLYNHSNKSGKIPKLFSVTDRTGDVESTFPKEVMSRH